MISILGPSTRWGVGQLIEWSGADSFSYTQELAVVHYPDMDKQCAHPFQPFFDAQQGKESDCVGYAGVGPPDNDSAAVPGTAFPVKSDINETSVGYQAMLRGEYTNPFDIPVTINPSVAGRWDFHGTTANQTFIEDRKAVTFSVALDYLQVYGMTFTYSNFFGAGRMHLTRDRDFVSMSLTYRL